MPKRELVKEHKQLIKVLKTHKGEKAETRKQTKELHEYEKRKSS